MKKATASTNLGEKINFRYQKIQEGLSDTSSNTPALFMCPDYGRALIMDENGFICSNVRDDNTLSVLYSRPPLKFKVEGKIDGLVQWLDDFEEMASTGSVFNKEWRDQGLEIAKQAFAMIDNALWNGLLWYFTPYEDIEKRDDAPTLVNFFSWLSTPREQLEIGMIKGIYQVYMKGAGNVPQDSAKAAKWLREAAEKGDKESQFILGVMYFQGDGVEEDDAEAFKWTQKAACQGHAEALYNLAYFYDNGCGVAQDHTKAKESLSKAAALGHEGAKAALS